MSDFYHLCFVVQDIEQATGDLSRARSDVEPGA
jgi:hypothetical protein